MSLTILAEATFNPMGIGDNLGEPLRITYPSAQTHLESNLKHTLQHIISVLVEKHNVQSGFLVPLNLGDVNVN
jgi:hypothetical protein